MPTGTSLYLRGIRDSRHGTPKAFAKKCSDHKLSWIAIAAIWQQGTKNGRVSTKRMNKLDRVMRYRDALESQGIEVWVWGYPWQGEEEKFVEFMLQYDDSRGRVLLDPELGSNPMRSPKGVGKKRANAHAKRLIGLFAEAMYANAHLGLSTFGSGYRMGWFPLVAFTRALIKHFGGRTFIGGQTYTDDGRIDTSIADMEKCIVKADGRVQRPGDEIGTQHDVEIVPNFGSYTWELNGKRGKRRKGAKAKPKTVQELRAHLFEFINEGEPIDSVIGWAENFMTRATWDELARFADLMQRGACRLPAPRSDDPRGLR